MEIVCKFLSSPFNAFPIHCSSLGLVCRWNKKYSTGTLFKQAEVVLFPQSTDSASHLQTTIYKVQGTQSESENCTRRASSSEANGSRVNGIMNMIQTTESR